MPRALNATERQLKMDADARPVHSIRHRSLKASIWKNATKNGPMYKVMVVRSYRDGESWRDTHGFGFDELMNVAKLFLDAHSWVSAEREKDNTERPRGTKSERTPG